MNISILGNIRELRCIMNGIILGIIAFILMYVFDIFTLYNNKVMKIIFGVSGIGLLIYSTIQVLVDSKIIYIPFLIRMISGSLCVIFIFLLIYSLFLELPFTKTYRDEDHNNALVDRGTYALCRHPGVLWFGFSFLFLFLMTEKLFVLYAGIIWTLIDFIYVILQERYIFSKMFPEYKQYLKTTPMIIPTKNSMKRCITTLGRIK